MSRRRLRYLPVPFGLIAWGAFIYAILVYPFWTAVVTGAVLIVGSFYLALFVWPDD